MKISVLTLGCKVNQAESFSIEGALKNFGHKIVGITEKPEVCIINTCTVTSKSDYQSRQLIRRARRAGARVLVTGCYSELNKESVGSMEGVEDVISNNNKLDIVYKLTGCRIDSSLYFPVQTRSRLFIKIQDGCNYSCSYCAIQKARGISRSLDAEVVVEHVNKAVESGYREIVLTGIHLGTYGHDLKYKVTLSRLIVTLLKKTKITRIRLSSLEVREVDDELIEIFSDKRLCNHLHIPLQSGDDNILKSMNRLYNSRQFSFKIEDICKKVPNIAVGTDIIVGFPGEGEAEFQNTYNLLESLPITFMHIFPFSPRTDTNALKMNDNTPFPVKKKRAHTLEALNKRKKVEYMAEQIGKTLDVLIEESRNDGACYGTSGNYLKILIPSRAYSRGSLVCVQIERAQEGQLIGIPFISHN